MLVAAGGAAAVASLVYLLVRDGGRDNDGATTKDADAAGAGKTKLKPEEITKVEVQAILKEISNSQDRMKTYIKELTQELMARSMNFEEVYLRVRKVQPEDPLERHGLSMTDFDRLLDKHQTDPLVREIIGKIMSVPQPTGGISEKVQAISVQQVLAIHSFMLEQLEILVQDYLGQGSAEYDMKCMTIAAQAIVAAKMEAKFGFTSEDIEEAVLMYHTVLATSQEFAVLNTKIQAAMAQLMGTTADAAAPSAQ